MGTFGSPTSPLWKQKIDMEFFDAQDDGLIFTDNYKYNSADTLRYDLGNGPVDSRLDSLAVVKLTVTYDDGTTRSLTNVVMFQDNSGNLFLANSDYAGTNLNSSSRIQFIHVADVLDTRFYALWHRKFQDFVCFVSGTRIQTPEGEVPVEQLHVGDLVITKDHGAQPILWIGSSCINVCEKTAPVHIRAGSLGIGIPHTDLRLSRQHRVLIKSPVAERMFQTPEIFLPAHRLCGIQGISLQPAVGSIRYFHILTAQHDILLSEGAFTESLYLGDEAIRKMGPEAFKELLTIFPNILSDRSLTLARKEVHPRRGRHLLVRHAKNNQLLYS